MSNVDQTKVILLAHDAVLRALVSVFIQQRTIDRIELFNIVLKSFRSMADNASTEEGKMVSQECEAYLLEWLRSIG